MNRMHASNKSILQKTIMINRLTVSFLLFILSATPAMAGAAELRVIPVTVTKAKVADVEFWESSVGQLEAKTAPMIAAEIGGRIVSVSVDVGNSVKKGQVLARIDQADFLLAKAAAQTDIRRLKALIRAAELQVKRLSALVKKQSANQAALDKTEAEYEALKAQLAGANVRLQQSELNLKRTVITSPVTGRVDERRISTGDYVKRGTPLFHITKLDRLRVRLPFPESLSSMLHIGLPVLLKSPAAPDTAIKGNITRIRPIITPSNRSIEILVDVDNPDGWEPGASVTGRVLVMRHEKAVLVPEESVVLRPAGTVMYIIKNGVAEQRVVKAGLRKNGKIEILQGLAEGEQVAVDGAGFLADNAHVQIKK